MKKLIEIKLNSKRFDNHSKTSIRDALNSFGQGSFLTCFLRPLLSVSMVLMATVVSYSQETETEVSGVSTGHNEDLFLINLDRNYEDASLRLQSRDGSGVDANYNHWMIFNENDNGNLHFSNYNSSSHSDTGIGTRRMMLSRSGELRIMGENRHSHFNFSTDQHTYIRGGKSNSNVYINDNGGNVGIGTVSPTERLHVDGNAIVSGTAIVNGIGIGISIPTERLHVNGNAIVGEPGETLKIGNLGFTDWAGVAHTSVVNVAHDYALMQNLYGATILNSNADQLISFRQGNSDKMVIRHGNVGIGTSSPSQKLEVIGRIKADGVTINLGTFPDYVFDESYELMSLPELSSFITTNGHLPKMPTEAEVVKEGMKVEEINLLLVEKLEELTLYTIEQQEKIEELTQGFEQLQAEMKKMQE